MSHTKERLTKKDLRRIFGYSYFIRSVTPPDRMQSLGLTIAMTPIFEKYYTQEERAEIMDQYMNEYYLTNPVLSNFIVGVLAATEERIAVVGDVTRDVCTSFKSALMGPLASIGDTMFNGTLRPLMAGICCALALDGNLFAPILFFVVMAGTGTFLRAAGLKIGYTNGVLFFSRLQESGLLKNIIETASIVSYMIIGAFASTYVWITLNVSWVTEGTGIENSLQSILDGIMPNVLPLSITLVTWYLFEKKKISAIKLIFGWMILGMLLSFLGIIF